MTYNEIVSNIKSCIISNDAEFDAFIDEISVALADRHLSVAQKEELIEQLLVNIEKQPEPEFCSWSLIHFIEWLDEDNVTNYNSQVLKSLREKPRYLTLLLLNRIINSLPTTSPERTHYITTLKEVASNTSCNDRIRKEANRLYEYQLNGRH